MGSNQGNQGRPDDPGRGQSGERDSTGQRFQGTLGEKGGRDNQDPRVNQAPGSQGGLEIGNKGGHSKADDRAEGAMVSAERGNPSGSGHAEGSARKKK